MKRCKQIMIFLLLGIMIISSAGCGKSAVDSKTTVISVWTAESHSKTVVENLINEFNNTEGAKLGIKIDYQVKSDVSKLVELGAATGELPDMFAGGNMSKLAEDGVIIALEDIEGGSELVDKYREYLLVNTHTYKGKTYRLPFSSTVHGLLYNKDMFKAAGIVDDKGEPVPPKTYKELRADAKKLTNAAKNEYGIVIPIGWGEQSFLDSVVPMSRVSTGLQNGYDPKTGMYDFTSMTPAVETILAIKKDGSVLPGIDSMNNDTARARFAAGGIGMKFGYSFDVGVLNDQFPAEIDWGVAPIPSESEDELYMQPYNLGAFVAINKEAVEAKGADKILKAYAFLYSDEFLKACYQEGCYIPYKPELTENIKYNGEKKGWAEFTELLKISSKSVPVMPVTLSADEKMPSQSWVEDIWSGKKDYAELAQTMTKKVNDAVAEYQKNYPEEDYNCYVIKDYDIKR